MSRAKGLLVSALLAVVVFAGCPSTPAPVPSPPPTLAPPPALAPVETKATVTPPPERPDRHGGSVSRITMSSDGRRFATAAEREVKIWDAKDLAHSTKTLTVADKVTSLAFSTAGDLLVGDEGGGLYVFDLMSGEPQTLLKTGEGNTVNSVACSPVEALAASGSQGMVGWDGVAVWDLKTGTRIKSLAVRRYVWTVAFSPDGKTILSVGYSDPAKNPAIELWDTTSGARIRELPRAAAEQPYAAAFSADGQYVVVGDHVSGGATLFDAAKGTRLRHFKSEAFGFGSTSTPAGFCRDGSVVIAGGAEGAYDLWDTKTGVPIAKLEKIESEKVTTFAATAEPRTLLLGTASGRLVLYAIPPLAADATPKPADTDHGGKSGVTFSVKVGGRESREIGRFDLAEGGEAIVAIIAADTIAPTVYVHYYVRFSGRPSEAQAQAIKALESAKVSITLSTEATVPSTQHDVLPGGGSNHSESGTHEFEFGEPVKNEDLREVVVEVGQKKRVFAARAP